MKKKTDKKSTRCYKLLGHNKKENSELFRS